MDCALQSGTLQWLLSAVVAAVQQIWEYSTDHHVLLKKAACVRAPESQVP